MSSCPPTAHPAPRSPAPGVSNVSPPPSLQCTERWSAGATTGGGPLQAALAVSNADLDRADVALASSGDHAAFERLYRRHAPRVTSLATWLLDAGDYDDAVQEVFIRVWQKLHTFAGQSSFGTWLHRGAGQLPVRRRRSRGRARVTG